MTGAVDPETQWILGEAAMRGIFLAVAFGWMFWWFHSQRERYEENHPEPNMPFYQACRWIALHSTWAENYNSVHDDNWVANVDDEIMAKIATGRIQLFGKGARNKVINAGAMQPIPDDFTPTAQWESSKLVSDQPPVHMWQSPADGGRVFYNIMVDKRQIQRVWPKRSLLAKILRRSPLERIGNYKPIFEAQDSFCRDYEPLVQKVVSRLTAAS